MTRRISEVAIPILVGGAVLITLGVTANAILPWWSGIALIIGLVVYTLFEKLAINTNVARSNELKRRELDLRN
jgi:membrane protein implicated in regulation of membrane protease activity